MKRPRV